MATSGSYDWTITRDQIITAAFRKIGALGDYESLSDPAAANRLAAGIAALNPMVKAFVADGMQLWCRTIKTIPMSSLTTPGISIGPSQTINDPIKYTKLIEAVRRDNIDAANPRDTPLNMYTWNEYEMLPTKLQTSTPVHIHYQPLAYTGLIYLWPLPDTYWQTNGQLIATFQRILQDFDAFGDEPDFPVEWHEALIYGLAVRLAPEYAVPLQDRKMLKEEADEAHELAKEASSEEGSLLIQPYRRIGRW